MDGSDSKCTVCITSTQTNLLSYKVHWTSYCLPLTPRNHSASANAPDQQGSHGEVSWQRAWQYVGTDIWGFSKLWICWMKKLLWVNIHLRSQKINFYPKKVKRLPQNGKILHFYTSPYIAMYSIETIILATGLDFIHSNVLLCLRDWVVPFRGVTVSK